MAEKKLYTCKRCGHVWMNRKPGVPVRCPNQRCRTAYWNKRRTKP